METSSSPKINGLKIKPFYRKKFICLKNLFIFLFWDNWDLHTIMRNNSEILCVPKSCLTVIAYHKQDFILTQSLGLAHIHQFTCTWVCVFTMCAVLSRVDSCAHHSQSQSSPSQVPSCYPFITTATHLNIFKGEGWRLKVGARVEWGVPSKVLFSSLCGIIPLPRL